MDLTSIATNLEQREEGLWSARAPTRDVAYPADAYEVAARLEEHSFWFRHRNAGILAVLGRFPPPGALFDVGGGNGFVAQAMVRAGYEVVLVEPGLPGVATARARGVKTVVCAAVEDAGFREGVLPAVGLFDVLEHMDPDTDFLQAMRRLLAPGGRLYLTVPAYRAFWSLDDEFARHCNRYTVGNLSKKLEQSGFLVDYGTYLFAPLALPIWLLRTLPSRLGLRRPVRIERARQEHGVGGVPFQRLLDRLLAWEVGAIRRGRRVPFGSSCLVAAHRA